MDDVFRRFPHIRWLFIIGGIGVLLGCVLWSVRLRQNAGVLFQGGTFETIRQIEVLTPNVPSAPYDLGGGFDEKYFDRKNLEAETRLSCIVKPTSIGKPGPGPGKRLYQWCTDNAGRIVFVDDQLFKSGALRRVN